MQIDSDKSSLDLSLSQAAISAMETAVSNGLALLEIRTDSKYTIKCKKNGVVIVSVANGTVSTGLF